MAFFPSSRPFFVEVAMIGHRVHLRRETRHRLLLFGKRRLSVIDHFSNLVSLEVGRGLISTD
jgi:hypothetical protein